jgi:hypothetical protein
MSHGGFQPAWISTISSTLACVAFQGVLEEVSELLQSASDEATQGLNPTPIMQSQRVLAYTGDCTIAVPACLTSRVAADLADIAAAAVLILIVQSCRFIGPEAAHIEDPVCACNPEGGAILGSPTGAEDYRAL